MADNKKKEDKNIKKEKKTEIQTTELHNESSPQEKHMSETSKEVNENEIQENSSSEEMNEEKMIEERWLEKILNHPIKTSSQEGEETVIKLVKDIIDPEKDIWYSKKKKKPILKETGTKKLILETGATFPKIIPIEKQSDSPSRDREQVWIEATVLFPDGSIHEEYGVANRMNCPDSISQANLPIMARKRAMHRAFYRSDYVGLYDIYDENETLDVRNEKSLEEIKKIRDLLTQQEMKYKKLVNQVCKEIQTPDGEVVWTINDQEKLVQLSQGGLSLTSFIAMLRIRHLNKSEKANS